MVKVAEIVNKDKKRKWLIYEKVYQLCLSINISNAFTFKFISLLLLLLFFIMDTNYANTYTHLSGNNSVYIY